MSLASMTGFARAEGNLETGGGAWRWSWELKSVNGKNLELRLRLPNGHDWLEGDARKLVQSHIKRGSVYGLLTLTRESGATELRVNEEALAQVVAALKLIGGKTDAAAPRLDGILGMRGVLESAESEETPEEKKARGAAILKTLDQAMKGLVKARQEEGAKIEAMIVDQVGQVEKLSAEADKCASARPEAIRIRMKEQIEEIMGMGKGLSEERLHQELAILATKSDVREEIDRLGAHVSAARDLLTTTGPVGRKFDFLAQEFNREANTVCSKSGDIELTQIGLEMKSVIDQLREQIQNLE